MSVPESLIAITGPAAAGKSTLARALRSALAARDELCLVLELDLFGRGLSREWVSFGERRGRLGERGFVYARAADGGIELSIGADARRVLRAFHRSVAAVARSGVRVVCETVVHDEEDWLDWREALDGIPACWVKLDAPLATLEERERSDRTRVFQGLARGMSARTSVGTYDLTADTAREAASEIARRVLSIALQRAVPRGMLRT